MIAGQIFDRRQGLARRHRPGAKLPDYETIAAQLKN